MSEEVFEARIEVLEDKVESLQEQIYEANGIIGELYHLCHDKEKASSVVCDYLVKYGKTLEVKSGV